MRCRSLTFRPAAALIAAMAFPACASFPGSQTALPSPLPPPSPAHAAAPDAGAVLAKMEEAGKRLSCLRADFRQERIYALFGDRKEVSGTIFYKKPGMMLWKYNPPDMTAIYLKGGRAVMYLPDIKQAQRISLAKDRRTESLLIGFGNTAGEITRNFTVAGAAGEGATFVLDLTPRNPELASQFERLRLVIDEKRWIPVRSERFERGGDRTIFSFSNIGTDAVLEDSLFDFTPPPGVEIVDY